MTTRPALSVATPAAYLESAKTIRNVLHDLLVLEQYARMIRKGVAK